MKFLSSVSIWNILFVAAFIVTAFIAFIVQDQNRLSETPSFWHSSFSTDPGGDAAFYRLLKSCDLNVLQWKKPLDKIDSTISVFIIMNHPQLPDPNEIQNYNKMNSGLKKWIKDGGTLIFCGSQLYPFALVQNFGIDVKRVHRLAPSEKTDFIENPDEPGEQFSAYPVKHTSFQSISNIKGEDNFRLKLGKLWKPLFSDKDGAVAAEMQHGKGKIAVLVDSDLASNHLIGKADNGPFLYEWVKLNLKPNTFAAIDEYSYGYTEEKSFLETIGPYGRNSVIQILLLIALGLWSSSRRFGLVRIMQPPEPVVGEYVTALGETYRKAKAETLTLESLYKESLKLLAKKLNASPNTPENELLLKADSEINNALTKGKPIGTGKEANFLDKAKWLQEANNLISKK